MSRIASTVFLLSVAAIVAPRLSSASEITLAWSPVGNPGNAPDGGGVGAVGYSYSIGTYDVTDSQYVTFLNSNDPTGANPLGLYTTLMAVGVYSEIEFNSNAPNGAKYSVVPGDADFPATQMQWYGAIRFANWVNNGEPVYTMEPTATNNATENGAYTLLGFSAIPTNANSITRNSGASVFLPNENEWYKAAYYDPSTNSYFNWPTSSNTPPTATTPTSVPNSVNANFIVDARTNVGAYTGTTSPYGAFDMGGDVWQWTETYYPEQPTGYIENGGSYQNATGVMQSVIFGILPADGENNESGFRLVYIAPVPEPSSCVLLLIAGGIAFIFPARCRKVGLAFTTALCRPDAQPRAT